MIEKIEKCSKIKRNVKKEKNMKSGDKMDLNIDQRRIIESVPNGHMAIKGVAGSGKTTVAMHKIPFLKSTYTNQIDDKILMVTYSKTLINYINQIYKDMKIEQQSVFDIIDTKKEDKVIIKTIDSLIYGMYYKLTKKKPMLIKSYQYRDMISRGINEVKKQYEKVDLLQQKYINFFIDEIQWIKSCKVTDIEVYQEIDRKGRAVTGSDGPQRLLRNSDSRKVVFKVMEICDMLMKKAGQVDFETMSLEVCLALEKNKIKANKYTHILIDECQDLSRCQLEILKSMYNEKQYSSFLLIGDTAQSIYPKSWLAYNSYKSIGFDMKGRAKYLSKNYRTTAEIAKAAYSLIEEDELVTKNEYYVKPVSIDRHGDLPVYKKFENISEEYKFVVEKIYNLSKSISLSEIAIVARKNNMLTDIQKHLIEKGIECKQIKSSTSAFEKDKISLLTLHSVKGLEFKVVIIIGLNEGIMPSLENISTDEEIHISMERKLLYVGMTRAKNTLILTSSGNESRFMKKLDKKLFKLDETIAFYKPYPIKIEDYKFTSKITSIFSEEEKIRQWVINELIEKLKYDKNQIEIEYKVNMFSKIGYVDIVVLDHNSQPYIFVEVKSIKGNLQDGGRQLRTYASTTPSVKYLVVTNGLETKIAKIDNNKITLVEKLPQNKNEIGNNSIFFDLINNKKYNIGASENNTEFTKLQVYGEVAAGAFIEVNENIIDSRNIPSNLLDKNKEYFMLKVKGDSMIDGGIDDGDMVVVKKQTTCNQMDIIVAITRYEGCTIKKYLPMGENVLLIPENKAYKPMEVKAEELYINGVVVGVVKN